MGLFQALFKSAPPMDCKICGALLDKSFKEPMCLSCRKKLLLDSDTSVSLYLSNPKYKEIQDKKVAQNDLYKLSKLGIEHETSGDMDSAIDVYKILIENKWDGRDVYNRLADIYLSRNQKNDAINVLQSFINMSKAKNVKDTTHIERFEKRIEELKLH